MILKELALVFLKLGTLGFGGPAAHIAMMEEEVVRKRQWLTHEEFLDLLGATNLIPGPNSTEMAIHVGHRRAGFKGLLVAGLSFILPAVLIVMGVAWFYVQFGALPQVQGILYGIKPVLIAIIAQAFWNLWPKAAKGRLLIALVILACVLKLLRVDDLLILVLLGFAAMSSKQVSKRLNAASLPYLFFFFLKVGAVLYGSGYVLLAFLQTELVDKLHWLTQAQLLDAVAVGQFTPGPVFTTATFIGYILAGPTGALLATIGIFLPAFIFVAISAPLIPKIRGSVSASAFLDGVNAAALGLLAATGYLLSREAMIDPWTIGIAIASLAILLKFKLNSAWLVIGGGILGLIIRMIV